MLAWLADSLRSRQNGKAEARRIYIEPTLVVLVSRLFDDEALDCLKKHVDALRQSFGVEEWPLCFLHIASCYENKVTADGKGFAFDPFITFPCSLLNVTGEVQKSIDNAPKALHSDSCGRLQRIHSRMCTVTNRPSIAHQ